MNKSDLITGIACGAQTVIITQKVPCRRYGIQGKGIWKLSTPGPYGTRSFARQGSTPDIGGVPSSLLLCWVARGTQLPIALLGRTGSASLEVRGVARAEKIEHAPHPAERSSPPTLVSGRSAYVLRKGAIRSDSNWDFQTPLKWGRVKVFENLKRRVIRGLPCPEKQTLKPLISKRLCPLHEPQPRNVLNFC